MTQHETGRVYGAKMRAAETRVQAGDPGAAVELAEHAKGYTELIREHIRIEDEYFYRLADQLLTLAEQESVVARFVGEAGERPAVAGADALPADAGGVPGRRCRLAVVTDGPARLRAGRSARCRGGVVGGRAGFARLGLLTSRLDVAGAAHSSLDAHSRQQPRVEHHPDDEEENRAEVVHPQLPLAGAAVWTASSTRRSRSSASRATSFSAGSPPTIPMAETGAIAATTLRPAPFS